MSDTTPRKSLSPDRSASVERTVADLGGLDDAGPVIREEPELTLKDKRIDAMSMLLRTVDDRLTSDTSRRAQEELGEAVYDTIYYYDRWLVALRTNLINLGYLTAEEIDAKIAEVKARHAA
jgi:nitrile hydratase subunit beta